jgi:hypothetical protein
VKVAVTSSSDALVDCLMWVIIGYFPERRILGASRRTFAGEPAFWQQIARTPWKTAHLDRTGYWAARRDAGLRVEASKISRTAALWPLID